MVDTVHPLTEEHLNQINTALQHISEAEQQIKLAKQAGIDVGTYPEDAKAARDKLEKIKQVYFPGR